MAMPAEPDEFFTFTSVPELLVAFFARRAKGTTTELAGWLSEELVCVPEQVFNLLTGERKVQPEQVAVLARVMELSEERQEYFRRLVVLQNATPEELKDARLSVWEMHAAHRGIPAAEIAAMLAHEHVHGATEGALLPILAVLRGIGGTADPRALQTLLVAPPDPGRLRAACALADTGATLGTWVSPRMLAVDGPGSPDALNTAAWHGLLDLTRECLHRVPMAERPQFAVTWSADEKAARGAARALGRLESQLRAILSKTGEQPITRVYAITLGHLGLTEVAERDRPAFEIPASVLPAEPGWSREQVGGRNPPTSPDGRPCIYRYLAFSDFARDWRADRKRVGKPYSSGWLAEQMGVSKTLAHAITTGRTSLQPGHVRKVIKGFSLSADEGHYAEGLARYAQATDLLDRARELRALLDYAAARGVRTSESEAWKVASYWGARGIWALSFLPHFRANAGRVYLALRGRIPLRDVVDLLSALVATGMLVKQEVGPPRPCVEGIRLDLQDPAIGHLASNAFQDSVLRLLQHELITPAPDQHFRAWILALPDAAVPLVEACLAAFKTEIIALAQAAQDRANRGESALDRVLLTTTHLFPVTTRLSTSFTPEVSRR